MDNLKSPSTGFTAHYDRENTEINSGFTKLELASLMAMQGLLSNSTIASSLDRMIADHDEGAKK